MASWYGVFGHMMASSKTSSGIEADSVWSVDLQFATIAASSTRKRGSLVSELKPCPTCGAPLTPEPPVLNGYREEVSICPECQNDRTCHRHELDEVKRHLDCAFETLTYEVGDKIKARRSLSAMVLDDVAESLALARLKLREWLGHTASLSANPADWPRVAEVSSEVEIAALEAVLDKVAGEASEALDCPSGRTWVNYMATCLYRDGVRALSTGTKGEG